MKTKEHSIIIMAIERQIPEQTNKNLLFEYLVYLLEQWRQQIASSYTVCFTKLKLQKILFLVASVNATEDNHPLLDVFDRFYALPYGPVEIDIYHAMNNNEFSSIYFSGNNCFYRFKTDSFSSLEPSIKDTMDASLKAIKEKDVDYITMPPFELVNITHKWTSWQVAMQVAEILGNKKEYMSAKDICNSSNKAFK